MGKFLKNFSNKASVTKGYQRPQHRTYLTATEWRNVDMSEEYAAFLQTKQPFYRFPFFYQLYLLWKVFFKSYAAARKESSHLELIFSEVMLMTLFVAINTTFEYAVKGLVSLLLWPFLPKKNSTEFQGHVAHLFKDYADFIHHTPFYNYSYFSKLGELFSNFWKSKRKSFVDVVTLLGVAIDFIVHGIVAFPVGFWYNKKENKEAETIDVLVKMSSDEGISEHSLDQELRQKIAGIKDVSIVEASGQERIFTRLSNKPEKHRTYVYAQLRVPRYEPFQSTVERLADAGICVREIAGQHHIQLKCLIKGDTSEQLHLREEALSQLPDCRKLFSYHNGIEQGLTFFSLDVPTKRLTKVVQDISTKMEGTSIKLMHDF
jgi:hypothetical protein